MEKKQFYIYKKEVEWSVLHEGFSIPVSIQVHFQKQLDSFIKRGESKTVKLICENKIYEIKLVNQLFSEKKYPKHKDIIQIRYSPKSDFAKMLREIFYISYNYLKTKRDEAQKLNVKQQIKVPEEIKEYLVIYSTGLEGNIFMECITNLDTSEMKDYITKEKIEEEDFELSLNYPIVDRFAKIEEKQKIVKIRKLDRAIGENLKLLYEYKCQICGENFGNRYGARIVETHHIEPFVKSLNNNADNIVIICPNHHRIIHIINPIFDIEKLIFLYPNGLEENLSINKHLCFEQ